jgi:uncharacterized protein (TIGR00251 family)
LKKLLPRFLRLDLNRSTWVITNATIGVPNYRQRNMIELATMFADVETKLTVHVQPNANRNKLIDLKEGILRLMIAAPPVDNKANRELVDFLSDLLGLRKSDISIDKGALGRNKIITIHGIDREQLMRRIAVLLAHEN